MRDLQKTILKFLKPHSTPIFKQITEKIKINVPFLHTYGISQNGKFYATFSNQENQKFLEVWDLENKKKFKTIQFADQDAVGETKLIINNDASLVILQSNDHFHSINLAEHKDLDKIHGHYYWRFLPDIQEMFFTNNKLIAASKITGAELKQLGIESKEDDNAQTQTIFGIDSQTLFEKNLTINEYHIYPENKKLLLINKGKNFFMCALSPDNEKIQYLAVEPITQIKFLNSAQVLVALEKDNKTFFPFFIRFVKSLKPLHAMTNSTKKIIDTFAIDNSNKPSIIRATFNENKYKVKGFNFSLLSNPSSLNHVATYFVEENSDNKSLNLYCDEALTFLIKRSEYIKDFSVKNSNLNDAQSFLLLALEEAAKDDNPYVELKEIMKSAYNTMPRQIRELYEHHVILKD